MSYDHNEIDKKWQDRWEEKKTFQAQDDPEKKKYYILVEFPFPSGAGLHVGHPRSYSALDVIARKKRMEGFNVLYPIGWDAFGLPTENYAIKTGRKPQDVTKENIDTFRRQLKSLGLSFDWSREVNTSDPNYYKWTQWQFIQFFKAGLAYKKNLPINWCPSCKIGLANEEVIGGKCERCGHEVEKRDKEQWMIAITKYADRLIDDLEGLDYLPKIKKQQIDWIGRSEGAEIEFKLNVPGQEPGAHVASVFTTRPDTILGATFLVVSPELAQSWIDVGWDAGDQVKTYIKESLQKKEFERAAEDRDKTGVDAGITAINPANGEEIPVWIADYVLGGYGTGAIMAVPQHDDRDRAFAEEQGLLIADAPLVDSNEIIEKLGAKKKVNYKLRDWVFSRQRYWGEPIPLVKCEAGCSPETDNWVAIPDDQLPVELPDVDEYEPTDSGESPLAKLEDWVKTECPNCGGAAKRETDTMPNWAGSSWYFLRYTDPKNKEAFASKENLQYWMPVDLYNGGMEHTTLHLLYSRFWNKFLYDQGLVPTSEPYKRRHSHGLILAEDGSKMSKSKGNVVNPDEEVEKHGADALRVYELFIGPFEEPVPWSDNGLIGVRRFLERVHRMPGMVSGSESEAVTRELHQMIKKVTEDIEGFRFNTAVAKMMEFVNSVSKEKAVTKESLMAFLTLLNPFAPHVTNEVAEQIGESELLERKTWPAFDESLAKDEEIELAIQVNGKLRGTITVPADISEEEAIQKAREVTNVAKYLEGEPKKSIYVPGRLVNFVI